MTTYEWITTLLVPVTGVVSWLAGSRKRRNEAIVNLQNTINLLAEKNHELYEEVIALRAQVSSLKQELDDIRRADQ